jgi:magnesium-transporting ATPase (P-type)
MAKDNNGWETAADQENVEMDLTMAGIFGLKDPLRDGIKEAVATCHKAGINVRMVTGDNIDTARAISLEAGIITHDDLNEDAEDAQYVCMTGVEFRNAICGEVVMESEEKEIENEEGKKEMKTV